MNPPVELRHLLLHRIAWIALGTLLLALPWLWFQARSDIHSESQGAEVTAATFSRLLALQNSRGAELEAQLLDLAKPDGLDGLRHLQLSVEDEQGRLLTPPPPAEHPFAERLFATPEADAGHRYSGWIHSADGRRFHVTVMPSPASEAKEAMETLVDLLIWCAVYTVLLVAGITLAMHRAFAPLRSIVEKISDCMSQNYATRLPALQVKELDIIGQSLNHLADTLDKTEASRRTLSLKMVSVQEEERTRLVQELHDEFGQSLTAMRAEASYLIRATGTQPEVQNVARELADQCQQVHGGIRELLRRLRPLGDGDRQGPVPLGQLLEKLLASWRNLPGQSVHFTLHYSLDDQSLPAPLALALYRMTQEALTNSARHANAHHVEIHLGQEDDKLIWSVRDDGKGIANMEEALQRGNGLAGLRERVWAHGGSLQLAAPSSGTGLTLSAQFRLAQNNVFAEEQS
ncbi:MAG TPA: histidine kinase [Rhodocyclaceae bacterium]|jgi:two-component system sensor histidine kinase UhpB